MKKVKYVTLALLSLLTVLIVLKLAHLIVWPWWLVLSPALLPMALMTVFAIPLLFTLLFAPKTNDNHDN